MSTVDIALIVLLGGFVLTGFWFGIVHMVGSIAGLALGAILAGKYYDVVANAIAPYLGNNANLGRVIGFFLVFVIINRLFGFLLHLLDKAIDFFAVIPFFKTFNRLLGAALGFIEGTLVLGLAVYFASRFSWSPAFAQQLQTSSLARAFVTVGAILIPLLPQALRALQSVL